MLAPLLIVAAFGYLLGSLPFGYLVARAKGVNIFEVGSKNPGATNVGRVLGPKWGRLVFALDALKGAAATFAPWGYRMVARDSAPDLGRDGYFYLAISGLVGAFLGHSFSCFTKFRGGKGVATGAGGFAVLFPQGALVALGVWLVVVAVSRYVSLASMLAAVSLPASAFLFHQRGALIAVSAAVAALVVVRHRANISRLVAGTENKLGAKAAAPKP
jgi:glycerol-3-phosphate acyltransferase PlsY